MNMEEMELFLSLSEDAQLSFLAEMREILSKQGPALSRHHPAAGRTSLADGAAHAKSACSCVCPVR